MRRASIGLGSTLVERMEGDITRVAKRKLKVGDKIRVTGYRPGKYAPGVVDDMGTEELFKYLVGRRYTVRGIDDYGNIELRPKPRHTVWIEPDLVELDRRTHAA